MLLMRSAMQDAPMHRSVGIAMASNSYLSAQLHPYKKLSLQQFWMSNVLDTVSQRSRWNAKPSPYSRRKVR